MATHDDAGGDLRARVVKILTDRATGYESALVADGALVDSGSYTIPSNVLHPAPRPTVDLSIYYAADEGETVLAEERVQAVFRNSGVVLSDPATGHPYTQFTFYVLCSLAVPREGGGTVECFIWAADPEAAGSPPYDPAAGTQGFAFDPSWTAVPL